MASPTILVFSINPFAVTSGGSALLTWAVTGATSVRIEPGVGSVASVGSISLSPSITTVYKITATNGIGIATTAATLTVNSSTPPVVASFSVNPSVITAGQTANLTWNVTGATSVRIDPTIGTVAGSGNQTVSPTATTTYTLTASNGGGTSTGTAVIAVNHGVTAPAVLDFGISPSAIVPGQVATLHWNVTGATSVFIDQGIGSVPAVGSQQVSPYYTTTYVLTVYDIEAPVTVTATLQVTPGYSPPYGGPVPPYGDLPLIASFTIDPPSVSPGTSATMSWSVAGADLIIIDRIYRPLPLSGSMMIMPTTTATYILTASNSAGSVTASATATVGSSTTLPVILGFSATPTSILVGQTSTLQWRVTGATSVTIDNGIGAVAPWGRTVVSPTANTAYTLTATNSYGSSSASVTVMITVLGISGTPVIVYFVANPATLGQDIGLPSTLQWNVTGANSVFIDRGIVPVLASGTRVILPRRTTVYTLTAINSAGVVMNSVQIRVN
jgi:hypothetical protein